jgi:hypothetical protein
MLIRAAIAVAMALSVIVISDARASCKKITLPEIIGVAVFKHYRHDGGEVVDVLINNDVVRHYRTLGSKAKVRKLQIGKSRQAGWVPKSVLSKRQVQCVSQRPASEPKVRLFELFDLFFDSIKPLYLLPRD